MKKLVKKAAMLVLSTAIILGGSKIAKADVIWYPSYSNQFYTDHIYRDIVENYREYIANGPDGKVIVYESPEDSSVVAKIANGKTIGIEYTYRDSDKILWGFYKTSEYCGWVPIDYFDVVYDEQSYMEEHNFTNWSDSKKLPLKFYGKTVTVWSYPYSSDSRKVALDAHSGYEWKYLFRHLDEYGNIWVYVIFPRYMYQDYCWMCYSAPNATAKQLETWQVEHAGEEPFATKKPEPTTKKPEPTTKRTVKENPTTKKGVDESRKPTTKSEIETQKTLPTTVITEIPETTSEINKKEEFIERVTTAQETTTIAGETSETASKVTTENSKNAKKKATKKDIIKEAAQETLSEKESVDECVEDLGREATKLADETASTDTSNGIEKRIVPKDNTDWSTIAIIGVMILGVVSVTGGVLFFKVKVK